MKKTVLKFGFIGGAILSGIMAISLPFHEALGNDRAMFVGYASMVLAFLMVYFGVRSYRDTVGGGTISFGRALAVGALIAALASTCYVATWEVIYNTVASDYLTKYQARMLEKERAAGASEEALAQKAAEMAKFAELYKNPAINAAITFLEPMPVALVMALVSAGLLRRRRDKKGPATHPPRVEGIGIGLAD
jgi:hypothetical protein